MNRDASGAARNADVADATLLRLLVCGSVDDGKSTLIGRMLLDTGQVLEDQLAALAADSRVHGTMGDALDPALLTDGLTAEREQGITIDVAWRQLRTSTRQMLIADTPGHVQHTRNMATGASGCEAAVVLVSASQGVLEQTRRHTAIATLMGIQDVVFAVNKVDLLDFDAARVGAVGAACIALAAELGLPVGRVSWVPVVARDGDNVVSASERLKWWGGPTLLETLENFPPALDSHFRLPFRLPVQLVVHPDASFRGYAGTIDTGRLRKGDVITALPSGVRSRVERIVTLDGDLEEAGPNTPVVLVLADDIDLTRGDLLILADSPEADLPLRSHRIDATVVWLGHNPHSTNQRLLLRSHTGTSGAKVQRVAYALDMTTLAPGPASGISANDVVRVVLDVDREHVFDPYERIKATGAFVLIDRATQSIVAAGLAHGIPSAFDNETQGVLESRPSWVSADQRRTRFGHASATLLITGMSGSGKTTFALALEKRLFDWGATVVRLDGEALRMGLSRGLGFGPAEREEHLRRAAETAKLLNDHGQIVLLAAQAPAREVRDRMTTVIGANRVIEIHLHAPKSVRQERDPSGVHAAVARGEVGDFQGISVGYEPPLTPDLSFDTSKTDLESAVEQAVRLLHAGGVLPSITIGVVASVEERA